MTIDMGTSRTKAMMIDLIDNNLHHAMTINVIMIGTPIVEMNGLVTVEVTLEVNIEAKSNRETTHHHHQCDKHHHNNRQEKFHANHHKRHGHLFTNLVHQLGSIHAGRVLYLLLRSCIIDTV